MAKKTLKVGTVFSGIGAIEQALKLLGVDHEIVFACDNGEREIDINYEKEFPIVKALKTIEEKREYVEKLYINQTKKENLVKKSYLANYKVSENRFFEDIKLFDGKDFEGQVDLLVGGSPCQAFSSNGKRLGFEDTRGTLFYEYARTIKEVQPKCFIFENVRGLINHDKGNTWKTIKAVFQELNYDIFIHKDEKGKESPTLNAEDYGIPQTRNRIYVVGMRKDVHRNRDFEFPAPQKLTTKVSDYLDSTVPASYYLAQKGFEFVTTHPSRAQVGADIMNCQKAIQQFNWNGDFIFEPLSEKHTLEILKRAYIGEWKGEKGVIRKFTPRECMRLMGFPDSFVLTGKDNIMYRQCGNSIVVNVLQAIYKEIEKTGIF